MARGRLEIEVKFLIADLEAFRQRLLATGASLYRERTYEQNVRYDTPWDGLALQGKLLRLRQDTAARLTFKGHPATPIASEARVREELEVEVTDFETMDLVLERVGFEARQRYEKYRETYKLDSVEIVLDELPFGDFVELEGDEAAIRKAVATLDLAWQERILINYLEIMARVKSYCNLPFDDLTFANFAGIHVSLAEVLRENQ